MLHGINPNLSPDLLYILAKMGHGDQVGIVDQNFPAFSVANKCVIKEPLFLTKLDAPKTIELITTVMPLDAFFKYGALRMEIDNLPKEMGEVHHQVWKLLNKIKPEGTNLSSIDRQNFYSVAKKCFAIIQTAETRPFGCFILRKGVIF